MTTEATEGRRPARHRSPSYPGIGLADAIERARAIYLKERMNTTPVDVINLHWGYRKDSSNGGVVTSALIKFGLLADQGTGANRAVHLTEVARRIILGSEDRSSLIREAALAPAIHRELWDRYSEGLPSRETLRRYLLVERNFNERVIDDFIDQFTGTLEFAGVLGGDSISEQGDDIDEPETHQMTATATTAERRPFGGEASRSTTADQNERGLATVPVGPGLNVFVLPISRRQQAFLHVPADLDERGWDQMLSVLNAMKPGILADDGEDEDEDERSD